MFLVSAAITTFVIAWWKMKTTNSCGFSDGGMDLLNRVFQDTMGLDFDLWNEQFDEFSGSNLPNASDRLAESFFKNNKITESLDNEHLKCKDRIFSFNIYSKMLILKRNSR